MNEVESRSEAVEAAIQRLYSAFAKYLPTDLASRSSYAGIDDAQVVTLQSRPLRELSFDDLQQYIRSALNVWGGVTEFKYFLPRIFELIVRRPTAIDPLVFEKLHAADWRTWPTDEQDAVDTYLTALWQWQLALGPDVVNASDTLRGLGLAGYDLRPWLDEWRSDRTRSATDQLADFVLGLSNYLESQTMPRRWHPKDHVDVLAFLLDPDTRARLEAAFAERPDGETGRRLADAADVLARALL